MKEGFDARLTRIDHVFLESGIGIGSRRSCIEGGRHAFADTVGVRRDAEMRDPIPDVDVQVDQPGRDDHVGRVDHRLRGFLEQFGLDRPDSAVGDADIPYGLRVARGRIEQYPVLDEEALFDGHENLAGSGAVDRSAKNGAVRRPLRSAFRLCCF